MQRRDHFLTLDTIKKYKECKIVYFFPEEHSKILDRPDLVLKFEEILRKNKSYLEIWLGNFEDNTQRLKKIDPNIERISIVNWSTYLANLSYSNFLKNNVPNYNKNIDFLFLSLNRRPLYHRCLLMDKIYQKQMNNYGKISWLNRGNRDIPFDFKYFDNKYLILDTLHAKDYLNKSRTHLYENSLFDIISETTVKIKDVSEKTWFSYLYEKPNIILGHTGIHKRLELLGFSVYDEFFDYNFDSNTDLESKVESILNNVMKYKAIDYLELYNSALPKIKQNKNAAIDLIYNTSFVPEKLFSYRKKYSKQYPLLDYYAKVGKII